MEVIEAIDPENLDVEVFEKAGIQLPNTNSHKPDKSIAAAADSILDHSLRVKDSRKDGPATARNQASMD